MQSFWPRALMCSVLVSLACQCRDEQTPGVFAKSSRSLVVAGNYVAHTEYMVNERLSESERANKQASGPAQVISDLKTIHACKARG
jgi:hypothetical protein